jgi:hypothetical protein
MRNGELLVVAEKRFNVLVTTDRNLRYQQNWSAAIFPSWSFRRRIGRVCNGKPARSRRRHLP